MKVEKKSSVLSHVTDKTRALALICMIVDSLFLLSLPALEAPHRVYSLLVAGTVLIVVVVGIVLIELAEQRTQVALRSGTNERTERPTDPAPVLLAAEQNRHFEAQVLSHLADCASHPSLDSVSNNKDLNNQPAAPIRRVQATAIAVLLRDLGLLTISPNGQVRPVSDLAACFVKSLAVHLEENLDFIGGWTEHGRNNPKARTPRTVLREIEARRITEVGERKAKPIRLARAALVIFKAQRDDGEDVFLTQLSDSWGPAYFWFIGGVMENDDGSIEACAYRELSEELALKRPDIAALSFICRVSDRRISERLGVLSEYDYHVFYAQLTSDSPTVKILRPSTHKLKTYHGMAEFSRNNKWQMWREIMDDPNMQEHAAAILAALKPQVSKLPYSVSWKVPK